MQEILKLLPSKRRKRGLINAGGYALKWLFGVAVSDDLEHVISKVEELKLISGSSVHSKQSQLTLMKDMISKIITNSKAIKEVMSKLSVYNGQLMATLTGYTDENVMLHRSLTKHMQVIYVTSFRTNN